MKMSRWGRLMAVLLLQLVTTAGAVEMMLDQSASNRQVCSGMYSKKSWGGSKDPYIMVKIVKPDNIGEGEDPLVSLVMFEWRDRHLVGKRLNASDPETVDFICEQEEVNQNLCTADQIGSFILADNATETSKSQIISQAIHLNEPQAIPYSVVRTGYYCVGTWAFDEVNYKGVVEFRNAFGQLPAAQIAKLPFYAATTLVYALLAIGWGALYYMNRRDILPVQNYITAILVFLVVEMFMTWLFYDFQNRHGLNTGAKVLLIVVSILSAARNSFSFFLLLIVCMGYGVVKPTLGKTMIYVRWLAITHFVFGVIYAVASLSVAPENAGPIVLLVVLPLAATLTGFYVWTLSSLNQTMKDLTDRRQTVKAGMYRKLWWCILISIIVIFAFFFLNSWTFAGQSDEDFVPTHWQSRWFILDGWLNLVYFADVAFVAYIWRPTVNNRRFAMSDEIAQDDDGFEIASIRDSMDIDDDLEAATGTNGSKPPAYNPPRPSHRDVSPLPAPVPTKPAHLPRASLEGQTIFAIDDEDRFSDDEGDDHVNAEESKRLTGKRD